MANPVFNAFGNKNGGNNLVTQFQQFMQQMKGQNPTAIINQMVSSGQINQQQLNMLQQRAQDISSQLNGLKNMFGFKG